ncbi:hypothetical protein MPOCJGCO_0688 [Methylobacterium trifolii]|uniref:Uncharacterized protein n=1 Tax=Methylobacterium trifolii TaxID=1003092 RepID=A0ABQ4TTH0_9HYPH|nr:hypothetical protein MPOCJGCO_0688 [Methylobacterium trifolii]
MVLAEARGQIRDPLVVVEVLLPQLGDDLVRDHVGHGEVGRTLRGDGGDAVELGLGGRRGARGIGEHRSDRGEGEFVDGLAVRDGDVVLALERHHRAVRLAGLGGEFGQPVLEPGGRLLRGLAVRLDLIAQEGGRERVGDDRRLHGALREEARLEHERALRAGRAEGASHRLDRGRLAVGLGRLLRLAPRQPSQDPREQRGPGAVELGVLVEVQVRHDGAHRLVGAGGFDQAVDAGPVEDRFLALALVLGVEDAEAARVDRDLGGGPVEGRQGVGDRRRQDEPAHRADRDRAPAAPEHAERPPDHARQRRRGGRLRVSRGHEILFEITHGYSTPAVGVARTADAVVLRR